MKRLQKLPCVLLALVLAACAAPAGQPQEPPAAEGETATAETAVDETAFPVGEIYKIPYMAGSFWGYNTGDAYYECVAAPPNNMGRLIVKTDYETLTQTPVCQVEGCTHDSEACPAYQPFGARVGLFVLDGEVCVYYIGMSWEYDSSMTDEEFEAWLAEAGLSEEEEAEQRYVREMNQMPTYIDVIAADGLSRRRLLTLDPEEGWMNTQFFCDGAALYTWTWDESGGGKRPCTGLRLDLATGETQTFPMMAREDLIDTIGGRLLTRRVVTDEPLPDNYNSAYYAALQNARIEFDLVELATGHRVQIYSTPYDMNTWESAGYFANYKGKLYFFKNTTNTMGGQEKAWVEYYDIRTKESGILTEDLPAIGGWQVISLPTTDVGMMPVGGDKQKRYIWMERASGDPFATGEYRLDLETGEVYETTQEWKSSRYIGAALVMAETNDGRWLIGYQSHSGSGGSRCDYGLIDREAFLQGSDDYDLVEMWP